MEKRIHRESWNFPKVKQLGQDKAGMWVARVLDYHCMVSLCELAIKSQDVNKPVDDVALLFPSPPMVLSYFYICNNLGHSPNPF
jgi:hypothetical protein